MKTKNEKKELYSRLGTQRNRSKKKLITTSLFPMPCHHYSSCYQTSVTSSSVRRYYPRAFPYKADTQNIRRGLPSPWAASSQSEFRWRIRYEQPGTRSETRTTTSTRFSQLVVLTRKPASFWLENVIAVVILLLVLARVSPFARWRLFTTKTRIHFVFPFIFKFGNPIEV